MNKQVKQTHKTRKTPFPVMENMTVKMVGEYLETRESIVIPIGVIEQQALAHIMRGAK